MAAKMTVNAATSDCAAAGIAGVVGSESEFARCYCCGLTEECTPAYIARVRERHDGFWICGLCAEAVKDEVVRSRSGGRIGVEEAMRRHVKFCQQFRSSSPPVSPGDDLISAVKHILRRGLDSGYRPLGRSKSCFAAIAEAPSE